jgi:molecular chaperone GrpE
MDEVTDEVMNEQENQSVDLKKQLEAEKKRNEECIMRIKYLQADFDNLQKRCDRQIQQATAYSNERLIIQLLDVVDELEMAIKTAKSTNSSETIIIGVEMTLKRLRKVLEQEGVFAIESQDKLFDPLKHNAVAAIERENVEGCVVAEEVRKGYTMKDKVLRPCTVKVAVKPSSKSQNKEEKINE